LVRLHGLKCDLAGAGRWGRGIDMPAFNANRSIMFGASDRNRTRAVRDTNAVPGQRGRHWPACGSDDCHSSQHGDRLPVIGIQVKKELIKISKNSAHNGPVADTLRIRWRADGSAAPPLLPALRLPACPAVPVRIVRSKTDLHPLRPARLRSGEAGRVGPNYSSPLPIGPLKCERSRFR
jgi:hypothetical protein